MQKKIDLDKKVERLPLMSMEDYIKSFDDLINFCSIIEKQKSESDQTLMKNYAIVRLVSLLEYNLKAFISELIDDLEINPKRILTYDSIPINPDVLLRFKSDNYTPGRIIIAHFDRMNPKLIYDIMSRINQLDYFEWYNSIIATMSPAAQGDFYERLKDLYKKRNDVIHNLVGVNDDIKKLVGVIKRFKIFGQHLILFTQLNIGIKKGWSESRQLDTVAYFPKVADLEKFLRDFKKITEKFRKTYPSSRWY